MKTALIGVSGFGDTHYRDLLGGHGKGILEIVAATVINQDEEKEKCDRLRSLGCEIFDNYLEMLEKKKGLIDVCFIPTGIHLHKPMTLAALASGANVFVEKPAAATIQEVNDMVDAEKKSGRFVAVGFQTIYTPETARIKEAILSGGLGRIRSIKCKALWPRTEAYYSRNNWAGRLKLGNQWVLDSPFNNALSHQLNLMCYFAGSDMNSSADLESVEAELCRANPIESADTACIRIKCASGIDIHFVISHACSAQSGPFMCISGEKGRILWDPVSTQFFIGGGSETLPCRDWNGMREDILLSLARRVQGKESRICSLENAAKQTLCVNGAHDSSEIVSVPDIFIEKKAHDSSSLMAIRGIEEIVEKSYEEERMFSELSVPWAVPGKQISLRNYGFFPSCTRS